MKAVIDDLAEMGTPLILLSGGEPLVREDFWEIAEYIQGERNEICPFHKRDAHRSRRRPPAQKDRRGIRRRIARRCHPGRRMTASGTGPEFCRFPPGTSRLQGVSGSRAGSGSPSRRTISGNSATSSTLPLTWVRAASACTGWCRAGGDRKGIPAAQLGHAEVQEVIDLLFKKAHEIDPGKTGDPYRGLPAGLGLLPPADAAGRTRRMPARSSSSSRSWAAGAVPVTGLPTLTRPGTCIPASLPRKLRSVSAMSGRRNSPPSGTMQKTKSSPRSGSVRSGWKGPAAPVQSENSAEEDAGSGPGHRTIRWHQKIRSARSGHRSPLPMAAGPVERCNSMELQLSLSDLPSGSRRILGDFPLHPWYKQVTEFGDRLDELATRIEWEPFIHLLAAGFWMRPETGVEGPGR